MATNSPNNAYTWHELTAALQWFIYLMAIIGIVIILIYGLRYGTTGSLGVISVGLMVAGASVLSGGLLGFLFGVPHSQGREVSQLSPSTEGDNGGELSDRGLSTTYRPNTSLEQISDWLAKMLVGVGLVEIKVIPEKLRGLAAYIAKGMGTGEGAEPFALGLLVYFTACGFVFGFLWARLYLVRLFREGDTVKALKAAFSRLEKQQQADALALGLIDNLTNPSGDGPEVKESDVIATVKAASSPVRAQIFNQAAKISLEKKAENYPSRLQGVISILKALIASDAEDIYHRNHSELSYALRRKSPPDLVQAENELTKAIEIRDRQRLKGWKYYEFLRARYRIAKDADFENGRPSDPAVVAEIRADLTAARSDSRWERWISSESAVRDWMALNEITDGDLLSRIEPAN